MFRYMLSFEICRTLLLLMLLIQLESILLWSSIVFHHYKTLKEKNLFWQGLCCCFWFQDYIKNIDDYNDNTILKRKIEKWNNYSSVLRIQDRIWFDEMLQTFYKYYNVINDKGDE
jgi:hypothetical protein